MHGNGTSLDGETYTGVVVQYEGDGFTDPPTVPAPAPLGTPCSE